MIKNYVLDTNVLIHDPNAYLAFEDNNVILPLKVIEEIDKLKGRDGEVGRNAREVARKLDTLRQNGRLCDGVKLKSGGTLKIEIVEDHRQMPYFLSDRIADDWILLYTMQIQKRSSLKTILVSKDINMRIKADALGITAQDYLTDRTAEEEILTGYRRVKGNPPKDGNPSSVGLNDLFENEFVIFDNSKIYRMKKKKLVPIEVGFDTEIWGIHPLNEEQLMALDLLLDDDVSFITLLGPAGTGKTLLALAVGLYGTENLKKYKKLIVTRPVVPVGKDIGFLPGGAEEKMRPWLQPIYDNLEFLFDNVGKSLSKLEHPKFLEVEVLSYTRGRSIPHQFIIVDEAQNLTPHEVKTIVTRVGVGTKIVLTGDISQIDSPYLDAASNGLTYSSVKFSRYSIAGHIKLSQGVRSELATLASEIL
ncbi:PhoH family protein [Mesoaciditoga sp.]